MTKPKPKDLSDDDVQKLLDYFSQRGATSRQNCRWSRNNLMFLLMLDAGIRVGELSKLTWGNLLYSGNVVAALVIQASIAKTKTERTIPLTARIRNSIVELWKLWSGEWPPKPHDSPFVAGTKAKTLTVRQIERIIGQAAEVAIGNWIYPHQLRHTFATRMMRITSTRVVQELLGHKRLSSTQIYTHPATQDLVVAIEQLDHQNSKVNNVQNN